MMTAPIMYHEKHNPLASGFVVFLAALMGAVLVVSAIDRISHGFSEVIGFLIVGLVAFFLALRARDYFFRPRLRLTDDGFDVRSFLFGFKPFQFDQISKFGFFEQTSRVTVNGPVAIARRLLGKSNVRFVKSGQLVCSLVSGKTRTITIPNYENSDFLEQVKLRTGKQIEELPPRQIG